MEAREIEYPAWDDEYIDAKMVVASEWLDARYTEMFPGLKVGMRAQVREWPRVGAYDYYGYSIASNAVPVEIENATYEATLREGSEPGSLSKDWTPDKYKRVSIDGALSVEYSGFGSASEIQTQFMRITEILRPILTGQYSFSALSGATSRV